MISVCIATYNGGKYIKEQLASILRQIGDGDEVVISDDGSTDDTVAIIEGFNDGRIKVINGAHRGSPIWNFEKAVSTSKGDVVFLADQDDVWLDNKVKISIEYLKHCDCVVSDAVVVDCNLGTIHESFFQLNNTKDGKWHNLLVKNGYLGCCMAFNRKVLAASLPFPKSIPMHDIWIGNVAGFKFDVKFIPEKLILFRRHENNNSTTAHKSNYPLKDRIMFRLHIIEGLLFHRVK